MEEPIDRNDRFSLLRQVGYVQATISELNRKIGKIDNELRKMPRREDHLKKMKERIKGQISRKHLYINELNEDFKKLL